MILKFLLLVWFAFTGNVAWAQAPGAAASASRTVAD